MFHLFSDIFACRDNALARMDPRTKLIIAVAMIVFVIASSRVILPAAIFIICLTGMIAVGLPWRLILTRLITPMGVVLMLVIIQSFTYGRTPLLNICIGHWSGVIKREGLLHGLLMGSRVMSAISVTILLSSVTPSHRIFQALRNLRVSKEWVEIAMLMYRHTFALLDHTADISDAQKVRLGYTGMKRSLSSLGVLAGAVIVHSVDMARRTHEAMCLRGYQGVMPYGPMPAMAAKDRWMTVLTTLAVAISYLCVERRLF
jgi:cobalt/nickel transport system permease protein